LDICDLSNELKNLRNELIRKDKQIQLLKEEVTEKTLNWFLTDLFLLHILYQLQNNNTNAYKNKQASYNEENAQNDKKLHELKSTVDELQNEKSKLMDEVRDFFVIRLNNMSLLK